MKTVLYKMDATGQIRIWTCEITWWTVVSSWGTMTKTSRGYEEPTSYQSVSDPFETLEQARRHYESLIHKKVHREGYTATIPKSVPFRPMLAVPYSPDIVFESFALQPKLDGFRCIGSNKELRSRDNTLIRSVPHIQAALEALPDGVKLDGELYIHGVDLQTISSYVKRNSPHPLGKFITYNVFDIFLFDMPFKDRYEALKPILKELILNYALNEVNYGGTKVCPIMPVDTAFFNQSTQDPTTPPLLASTHKSFRDQGYEGMIVRDLNGHYELDKRAKSVLKYKDFVDDEFLIVDVKEGKNRCAVFVCKNGGRTFDCSPAFTTARKQQVLTYKENYIGKWLHVKYAKLTPDGSPFHPTGLGIYPTKRDKQNPT